MKRFVSVVIVVLFFGVVQAQTYIQLILDLSGSMYEKLESGEPKIDAARLVLTDFISELPDENLNVGLRVYGATTGAMDGGACEDSQLTVAMQGVDKDALLGIVSTTNPKGATPIAYSLQQAVTDFQSVPAEAEKIIVLVTDGEESCGGDLQAALAAFESQGIEVDLRIVGLGLSETAAQSFEGVGATFENALDTTSFATALESTLQLAESSLYQFTFDTNDEGWLVYGDAQGATQEDAISKPTFVDSGGNPGGMICAEDSSRGTYWYWLAPLSGDQTSLYGIRWSFDLLQSITKITFQKDLVLEGNGTTLSFQINSPPLETWKTYQIELNELGWINDADGKPATREEFLSVLANLSGLRLRGEYAEGKDVGCLDNVIFSSTTVELGDTSWTFDNGDANWRVSGDPRNLLPDFVLEETNGYICATDGGRGIYWYFETPLELAYHQQDFYGMELVFDMKQAPSTTSQTFNVGDIVLQGHEQSLTYNLDTSPGTDWTTFRVKLDDSANWLIHDTEQKASSDDIKQVLDSLLMVQIRGEYRRGNDTGCLDNVKLTASE